MLFAPEQLGGRNCQKRIADPERAFSHRQSARRQPRLSGTHARLPNLSAPRSGAPSGCQQLYSAHRLFHGRHTHPELLRHLYSRRAGWRRSGGRFQRLGHAKAKRGAGPGSRRPEKSGFAGYFSERLLSFDLAPYRRPGFDLRGHHARRKLDASPENQFVRHSRHTDWLRGGSRHDLCLLRLCRPHGCRDWRKRHGDRPAALLLSPALHRSEEHTSELQSRLHLVCRLLLEKKKITTHTTSVRSFTVQGSASLLRNRMEPPAWSRRRSEWY